MDIKQSQLESIVDYIKYLENTLDSNKIQYKKQSFSELVNNQQNEQKLEQNNNEKQQLDVSSNIPLKTNLQDKTLTKEILERYSRQMLLPEIQYKGQSQLQNSKVLIIGAGGIGSPAAYYLAGMGIGEIGIIDHDKVEESNLHRQIIHNKDRIGINKALSAKMTIERFNQRIKVNAYQYQLTPQNAQELFQQYDVILDASDNPKTRYLVNDAAIINKKILISGSAIGWEGQLTVFGFNDGPCYRCLFPVCPKAGSVKSCGDAGVVGMIPGIIGLMEAVECMKVIIGAEQTKIMVKRMLIFDGYQGTYKVFKIRGKQKDCIACGDNPSIKNVLDFNYEEFVGASCNVSIPQKSEHFQDITWSEFFKVTQQDQDLKKYIDVRPSGQFDIVNFPLFQSIPYTDIQDIKMENYDQIFGKKDQPIYIMCRRGNNSKLACEFLYEKGYRNLYNIIGGINEYGKQYDSQIPFI